MIRAVIGISGAITGITLAPPLIANIPLLNANTHMKITIMSIVIGIIMGLISYAIAPWIIDRIKKLAKIIDKEISKYPPGDIILGSLGLIFGLFIAYLVSQLVIKLLTRIPLLGGIISIFIYIFMGYLGIRIALKTKEDIFNIGKIVKVPTVLREKTSKKELKIPPKVLDTSVIIDGRIADICQTGFIEGKLIVPGFVLKELRHIADSSDDLKRVRGRRGLDILNMMQKELKLDVQISDKDFEEIPEVDLKLLKLAQVLSGKVVTNDYNLNKVAQFQGVEVLNINELANSIKPVAIPGEEMIVHVVKEGKEANQGLAYLDDGTMIVVDGGKKHMGETINVLVTSALQTPAGRMIFAKPVKNK